MGAPRQYSLTDRYALDQGRVYATGSQVLARLPLEQLRVDRRRGWRTAAYISGYPGSPLAGFDRDVTAAAKVATGDGLTMVFQAGLNEELAATAVMGSQLAVTLDGCRFDGVIGIWYGKAPGMDRASDAIRHAVFAGTSPRGGAVALVGDDPAAKSSTLPSSSDANLVDLHLPILYPGDVQEALDLGRHAIALSRACGLWTSLKIVAAVADGTGTVDLDAERIEVVLPEFEVDGRPWSPWPSGRLVTPYTLDIEREFIEVRQEVARSYGALNRLNRTVVRSPDDWIGIVASGHTYTETKEALRLLGLRHDDDLRAAGIRLLQMQMPMPFDPQVVREFATGLAEVLVVEEKNPTLEWLVKDALYAVADRPLVTGKRDPAGAPLLPLVGTLDADAIRPRVRARLATRLGDDRLAPEPDRARVTIPVTASRTPYFCSGCPHNTSTRVPEGALVGGGIGCHSMVLFMEERQVGHIVGLTAMGNEGAQWFGMAPFVEQRHLVQNIGDGTLFHSGMAAVRAAVANGADITYKVLYNGAVAMTGGQHPFGQLTVPNLVQVFLAEGVKRVIVTTDDVAKYRRVVLPTGVEVWDRSRVVEAQQVLAGVPGTTVLIHDQQCAAEKRRERKRGLQTTPKFRVLIDERVCEGCGDCGEKSNCLSVQPVETPFGRKTRIDQTSCNLDLSCLRGDCPSFATVVPARGRAARRTRSDTTAVPDLPEPDVLVPTGECTVRLSGIGGTGVVTVSQLLGTAALLDGYEVRGLDQTGLSQKAGPVVSDLRLTRGTHVASNKATAGSVDTLLAFDLLVAAGPAHLDGAAAGRTVVVGSTSATPTGTMVVHPDVPYPDTAALVARLGQQSRPELNRFVDAAQACRELLGDATAANVFVLGVAVQAGALPVTPASVERAIELNAVSVEANLVAFRAGRRAALARAPLADGISAVAETGEALAARLADDLRAYQDRRYAERFLARLDAVRVREQAVAAGSTALHDTVARHLHRLMAYKDEYEVARLLLRPEARAAAEAVAGPGARVVWHLHPPLLRSLGMRRKLRLGRWFRPVLGLLRGLRRMRGTWLDPFGRAKVRRLERSLVTEYEAAVDRLIAGLHPGNLDEAVAIAGLPDRVRGYEHLKLSRAADYRVELARRLDGFS